jgi:hypothetical protein
MHPSAERENVLARPRLSRLSCVCCVAMDTSIMWFASAFGDLTIGDQRLLFEDQGHVVHIHAMDAALASVGLATDASVGPKKRSVNC